jgi:hypothetical protein
VAVEVLIVTGASALLNLPDCWLAGDALRNTVWRSLFNNDCQLVINGLDIPIADLTTDLNMRLLIGCIRRRL